MPERHALYAAGRTRGKWSCSGLHGMQSSSQHRREATPPDGHVGQMVLDPAPSWRVPTPNTTTWNNNNAHRPSVGSVPPADRFNNHAESQSLSSASPPNADGSYVQPGLGWDHQSAVVDASSASCDFSHLTDLDDIFTFTSNSFLPPGVPQTEFPFPNGYPHQHLSPPGILPGPNVHGNGHVDRRGSTVHIPGLNPRDHEYLRNEGCFDLPPGNVLRQMMHMYFRMVQPNLSIIAEDQFWSMWNGDEFTIGQYSFLLLRSMIFAATSVCCLDVEDIFQS